MASANVDPVPSLHLALYYPDSCLVLTTVPQGGPRIESPSGGRSGGVRRHSVSSARGPRAGGWRGGRKWAGTKWGKGEPRAWVPWRTRPSWSTRSRGSPWNKQRRSSRRSWSPRERRRPWKTWNPRAAWPPGHLRPLAVFQCHCRKRSLQKRTKLLASDASFSSLGMVLFFRGLCISGREQQ